MFVTAECRVAWNGYSRSNPARYCQVDLAGGNYGTCVSQTDPDDTDSVFVDTEIPDPSDPFTYLVTWSFPDLTPPQFSRI